MADLKTVTQVLQIIDDRKNQLAEDSYLLEQHQMINSDDIELALELEINRSQVALLEELYEEIKGLSRD